jgi:hypothetical protein
MFHEHAHWTAKADRCDMQLGKRFGDSAYAAEELIAELGAAFTCAHLGLSTEPRADHAQYIASLRVLKADKRAIFTAASKAQQAPDYLIQRAGVSARVAEVGGIMPDTAIIGPVLGELGKGGGLSSAPLAGTGSRVHPGIKGREHFTWLPK